MIFSNLQKITCIILRNLFGLDLFSHQSCATGTLLLQKKKIYPRKSSLNLKQLIFFMFLRSCFELFEMFFEVKKSSCSSRFLSQTAPLSSLEEAVETEVFHSQPFKQTIQNSFSKTILSVPQAGRQNGARSPNARRRRCRRRSREPYRSGQQSLSWHPRRPPSRCRCF